MEIDNRELGTPVSASTKAVIIRVILADNRTGISIESNPENYMAVFENALKTAKATPPNNTRADISPRITHSADNKTFSNFNEDELFSSAEIMRSELDNKAPLLNLNVSKMISKAQYYNSNGSDIKVEEDNISAQIQIGKNHRLGTAVTSLRLKKPDFKALVREAMEYYNYSKKLAKIKSGEYDVLFCHDALMTVMQPIIFSLTGDTVFEKKSQYAGKLNEKVLSNKIILADNPLHKNNHSSFDCEGYKTNKTTVINKGVIKTFLHDSYTSKALNALNTHNSSSIMAKPSVSFFNPEIIGTTPFKKMLAETGKGVIVYDLYPEHTVNNVTGAFGLNSSRFYYVKNGEIAGLVNGGVVTGNSYEIFKKVDSVSRETKYDTGNYNFPVIKTKAQILTQ